MKFTESINFQKLDNTINSCKNHKMFKLKINLISMTEEENKKGTIKEEKE